MGWLSEQVSKNLPPPPPPPQAVQQQAVQAAAPGAWWQQVMPMPQQQLAQSQLAVNYQPAQFPMPAESCPRCGSANYATVPLDTSVGGVMGGSHKRCFDCRYPNYNPSGEVINGKGARAISQSNAPAGKTTKTKQARGTSGWAGFDSAQNIDHMVS